MAFFSKLKERMFKSSAKIDAGLDAIVAEPAPKPCLIGRLFADT